MRFSSVSANSVPINLMRLSKMLGVRNSIASKMLNELLDTGCLFKIKTYNVGVNSNVFSIPDNHEECCEVVPLKESSMAFKIIEKRNRSLESYIDTPDGFEYSKYLKLLSINNYSDIIENIELLYISSMMDTYQVKRNISKQMTNLRRIANGDIFVTRKDPLSRVCCNFSILHNKLRKYLEYEGKGLSCIDTRNSQPLLAGMYIKHNLGYSFTELDEYISRCEKGMFYEDFMDGVENRKEFKIKFFEEVFFGKVTVRKTKLKKKFIEKYPKVYEIICQIKGGYNSGTHADFAVGMQRFEASIIYDAINLPMIRDGYPCFNIYDSIVSHSEEVLEEATKRIYKEFAKYGVRPTLNVENFNN